MNFSPQTISNLISGAAAWGAAFLVALWLSLIIWTYRDIRSRVRDPLLHILAVIIVALLFIPGIVIYHILRPQHTLEEDYQQTLEEEALLQSIEDISQCPGCGRHTKESWIVCPSCYTKLKKECAQCGKLMELSWNMCPYCATPTAGMRRDSTDASSLSPPSQVENEILADELEQQEERLNKYSAP